MKKLKIALGVLVGLIVALVLGGYAIDSHVEIEHEATMKASPEQLFAKINSFEGEVEWWTKAMEAYEGEGMPPMTVVHAGGPKEGKDMVIHFMSGDALAEEWTFLQSEPNKKLVITVDFQMFVVERTLEFAPEGEGTKVKWRETAEMTNPLFRYFQLIMPPEDVIKNWDMSLVALDAVIAAG